MESASEQEQLHVAAGSGGLKDPETMSLGPDGQLYVSSFMSDQILRFEACSGAFVDVFASGNGEPGSVNGPNGLAFGPDCRSGKRGSCDLS